MTEMSDKQRKVVEGIRGIVGETLLSGKPFSFGDARSQAAEEALRDERRLSRAKLDRTALRTA